MQHAVFDPDILTIVHIALLLKVATTPAVYLDLPLAAVDELTIKLVQQECRRSQSTIANMHSQSTSTMCHAHQPHAPNAHITEFAFVTAADRNSAAAFAAPRSRV